MERDTADNVELDADAPGDKKRVFLVDDHEIVRRGVRDLLEAEPDITVVGEAGTASSALARIPALKPGPGARSAHLGRCGEQ